MKNKYLTTVVAGLLLNMSLSISLSADIINADVQVQADDSELYFDYDVDRGGDDVHEYDWYNAVDTHHYSLNFQDEGVVISFDNSDGNALESLSVNSLGDINLAAGTVFIDKSTSNVGIGTAIPEATLDVQWSGSNEVDDGLQTMVLLTADNSAAGKASDAGFAMVNKKQDFQWNFRTLEYNEAFTATKAGSGGGEFVVQSPTNDFHDAIMKVGGVTIFQNGQLQTPSSRELKTDIKPLDTQAAMDAFHKLQPVTYAYKAHKEEPVVGFIAEDIPDLVATKSRTGIDSTEIVAVLTSVLAETRAEAAIMKTKMEAKDHKLAMMEAEIEKLKAMQKRLAKVESLLTNLALDTSNSKTEKISLNNK